MSIDSKNPSSELFEIKRNKKELFLFEIAGIILIVVSIAFFWFFHMVLGIIGKWIFTSIIAVGALIIFYATKNMNSTLINANLSGVWLNIVFSGKGIFIPWEGIKTIDSDYAQSYITTSRYRPIRPIKCLMFDITDKHIKDFPMFLKNVYLKMSNKIYFTQGVLSTPIDSAVEALSSLLKKNKGLA